MKKIFFCYSIVLTILFPVFFNAQEAHPEPGPGTVRQKYHFLHDQASVETSFFEDLSDDDLNDPERRKYSSGRSGFYNASFTAHHFTSSPLKGITAAEFYLHSHASHYLFTRVLRL